MVSNKIIKLALFIIIIACSHYCYGAEGDHFNRTDSTTIGNYWAEESLAVASISNNKLVISGTASQAFYDMQVYTTETCVDCEIYTATMRASTSAALITMLRSQGTNNNTGYTCYTVVPGPGIGIGRIDSDLVHDPLASDITITLTNSKWYWLYFKAINNGGNVDLTCKIYERLPDGKLGSQLASITYTDSSADKKTGAGVAALATGPGAQTANFDDFILHNLDSGADDIVDSVYIQFISIRNGYENMNLYNSPWNGE